MRSDRPDTVIGGRIDITSITLVSLLFGRVIEISELVDAFNLFENMFTNTLTGNISIGDTNNLISNFPIVGQEEIHISIGTPNIERVQTKVFRVYRVSDITSSSLGERRYSIHILSDEFFTNMKKSVSRSFPKSRISDIVDKLFRTDLESVKLLDVEETQNVHDIVIPNWKPFDAVNWLAKRSIAENRDGANYMFYETRDGFHFRSLESLFESESVEVYKRKPLNTMDNPDEEQYKSINRIDVVSSFDMLENIPSGMYANRLIVHDMINRKVENLDYDYAKEYSKMTHLESNKKTNRWGFVDDSSVDGQGSTMLIHESADELTTSPLSKQTLISRLDSTNDYYERTIQNRISQMQQINNIRLNITIAGDTTRKVGDVLDLVIPSVESISNSGDVPLDRLYNGRYLVTGLRHKINMDEHVMVMEVVKDSYFSSLPSEGV